MIKKEELLKMVSELYDSYEHLADSTEATTLRQVELMSMYEQTLEPLTMLEFGILGVMNEHDKLPKVKNE